MSVKEIFDTRFSVGASEKEPPIREMILHYYASHGTGMIKALKLTDDLIADALRVSGVTV